MDDFKKTALSRHNRAVVHMNSQTGVTRKKSEHKERGVSTKSHPRSFLLVIAADRKEIGCLQLLYQPHVRATDVQHKTDSIFVVFHLFLKLRI